MSEDRTAQLENIDEHRICSKFDILNSLFSTKRILKFDMNIQMSELMMSLPHNFPLILFTEMTKNPIFQL